jgi:hypothetical protein
MCDATVALTHNHQHAPALSGQRRLRYKRCRTTRAKPTSARPSPTLAVALAAPSRPWKLQAETEQKRPLLVLPPPPSQDQTRTGRRARRRRPPPTQPSSSEAPSTGCIRATISSSKYGRPFFHYSMFCSQSPLISVNAASVVNIFFLKSENLVISSRAASRHLIFP